MKFDFLTIAYIVAIIVILAIMLIVYKVRRKIIIARLNGKNIAKRNLFYRIVSFVFIQELPD